MICGGHSLWLMFIKYHHEIFFLNGVDGRQSMHKSIITKGSFGRFLTIFFDEFLMNIWTVYVTNPATVPESLSVVGGG